MINVHDWDRCGRGRSFAFFATDDEIVNVCRHALPFELSPYFVVAIELRKVGEYYKQYPITDGFDLISILRQKGIIQYYIGSSVISPSIELNIHDNLSIYLSLNGLIYLTASIQSATTKEWGETAIMHLPSVYNVQNGNVIEHKQYTRVYNAFVRGLKKIVVYNTIWNTDESKEDSSVRMSQGIIERYQQGVRYWARPALPRT